MKNKEKNIIEFTPALEFRESLKKAERDIGPFELYNELILKANEIKAKVRYSAAI